MLPCGTFNFFYRFYPLKSCLAMRTLLICHDQHPLDRDGLVDWLAPFSVLAGIVVLKEHSARKRKRMRREILRVGLLRFFNVIAPRYYD